MEAVESTVIWIFQIGEIGPMNESELREFGIQYEKAWRSLVPEEPFSYQAENCVASLNDGSPMISVEERLGRIVGLMEAFPDLLITMREIVEEERGTVFYWNLKGTNTGQEGTGNRIDIDGCEVWKLDNDNKITELEGYFDAEEYERQVNKDQTPSQSDSHKKAYGCFLFIGITLLIAPFYNSILSSFDEAGLFRVVDIVSLLLAPLLFVLGCAAGIRGTILSIKIGNERRLLLLSFLTFLFAVGYFTDSSSKLDDQSVIDWLVILYGLTATTISLQWFLRGGNDRIEKD